MSKKFLFLIFLILITTSVSYADVNVRGSFGTSCGGINFRDGNIYYHYRGEGIGISGRIKE